MLIQGVVFFYDKMDELVAIPLILILGGGTAYFLGRKYREDSEFEVGIFQLAFSARILVGMVFYGWDLSKTFGDEDSAGYIGGWVMAQHWYRNGIDAFLTDVFTVFFDKQNIGQFVIWGIPMFFAGGPSRIMVSVINSFAGALLVIVVYRMSRKIFDPDTARKAAVLVACWPSMILLSAGTSKEMLVILFEWSLLYFAIRNSEGLRPNDGVASIPALLALYVTRFYALYMVVAAFAIRIITSGRKHLVRNAILGTIVLGSVMVMLGTSGVVNRDFDIFDRRSRSMESWRENVAETTGTGVNIYAEYEGSVSIPVAAAYFFLAPFPWEIFNGSLRSSFAAVENIAILVILIMGFPALKIFFKDKLREMLPIFVFCGIYAGFHIWGLVNVGLAWRHKQTVMPMFFMLVALGITQRKKGWEIISRRFKRRGELVRIQSAG